jgi:hypothetical protein
MEQLSLSKGLAPRAPIARRSKPTLVQLDNGHLLSSDSKWHPMLAIEYVTRHRERWIPVGELAKVFYGANIPKNKARVRRCIPALSRQLIDFGELLVREIDLARRRVIAVKLYDARAEQDRQGIRDQLERLRQRKELSESQFHRAIAILDEKESIVVKHDDETHEPR